MFRTFVDLLEPWRPFFKPTRRARRPLGTRVRPRLEQLEDRVVPSGDPYMNYDPAANTLYIYGGSPNSYSDHTISIDLDGYTNSYSVTDKIGNPAGGGYGSFKAVPGMTINIDAGGGDNIIYIEGVAATNNLYVNNTGSGFDAVEVGETPTVQGGGTLFSIQGSVNVVSATGRNRLAIDDSFDQNDRTATLADGSLTWTNYAAPITWTPTGSGIVGTEELTIFGGGGNNTFNVNNTSDFSGGSAGNRTNLYTGPESGEGNNTVNVLGTTSDLRVFSGGGGSDRVNVGSASGSGGTLAAINGAVKVFGPASTSLTIDDSGDATGQTATLNDGELDWTSYAAPITWGPTGSGTGYVKWVDINGGSGGNTFTVNNTSNLYQGTTLDTGTGANTVDVLGTISNLYVQGNGGQDTVIVGSTDGSSGSLANIHGQVSVRNTTSGATALTIDDSADTIGRTATLQNFYYYSYPIGYLHEGELSWNSYAAPIVWDTAESAASVTINGGSGTIKTFNVSNTDVFGFAANTTLNTGPGSNNVKMFGFMNSPLTVNGQGASNTLDYSGYSGDVTVDLPLGVATLISGGISGFQNVIGSKGNDILVGDGGFNYLVGGTGRNLLIAGAAGDLVGNTADDILIGGSTQYDSDLASLALIMSEWTRTDLGYAARVNDILNGGGLNGSAVLNASTVTGNGGGNTLTGNGELALIFSDGADSISGFNPDSQTVPISP